MSRSTLPGVGSTSYAPVWTCSIWTSRRTGAAATIGVTARGLWRWSFAYPALCSARSELAGSDAVVVNWVGVRRGAAKRQRAALALEVDNCGRSTASFACSLLLTTEPIHPAKSVSANLI